MKTEDVETEKKSAGMSPLQRFVVPFFMVKQKNGLKKIYFNKFIERQSFYGQNVAFVFRDEYGKHTTARYRLFKQSDNGFLYKLDIRTIKNMKRIVVA